MKHESIEKRGFERRLNKDRRDMIRFELDKADRRCATDRRSGNVRWGVLNQRSRKPVGLSRLKRKSLAAT